MTVIEADGENTVPLTVDSLQIFAGQRYSVIVHTDKPTDNYWIRAGPNRGVLGFAGGINTAILRYAGAPSTDPSTDPTNAPTSLLPLKETSLRPLNSPSAPGESFPGGADVVLNMAHVMNLTTFIFKVNGVTYEPPTVPVLLQILSGVHDAQDLLPKGSLYSLPPNKVVEVSLPGTALNQGGPVSTQGSVSFQMDAHPSLLLAPLPSAWRMSLKLYYIYASRFLTSVQAFILCYSQCG